MLSVGHGILDQVLQEELQHRAGLLIDGTGDTLHTTTAGQAADGRLQGKKRQLDKCTYDLATCETLSNNDNQAIA